MRQSALIQAIFDRILKSSNRIEVTALLHVRRRILRYYDPKVTYDLAGKEILLPFSHQLPHLRKSFPLYSLNVARIAKHVKQKYPSFSFIDIGSNIGDTVVLLRAMEIFPILCIEGDKEFFQVLEHNVGDLNEVYLENSFVVANKFEGSVRKSYGTARIVQDLGNSVENQKTLSEVLQGHVKFSKDIKMVKIDTDGFDVRILSAELALLAELRPIVFFEYDPHLLASHETDSGIGIFSLLANIGYSTAIFYDNFGDYLLSTGLSNTLLIEDIHNYFSGRASGRYADVVMFHNDDIDLSTRIRCADLEFYQNYRAI